MRAQNRQTSLSAQWGQERVTIGIDPLERLRRLSDQRQLTCPGCGAPLVLHAGTVRTHHFAHLPGTLCSVPQSEPETEEHRAGKLLLLQWLQNHPKMNVSLLMEAHIPETNQRADILINLPAGENQLPIRIAIEYQCANLSARDWRRRHQLYREVGIADLWILGGSRLVREGEAEVSNAEGVTEIELEQTDTVALKLKDRDGKPMRRSVRLRTTELERVLLWDGAPLLFLDSLGVSLPATTLARFRPGPDAQALHPRGQLQGQPLLGLAFPFALLDWPKHQQPDQPASLHTSSPGRSGREGREMVNRDSLLWIWLEQRHRVTATTLPEFFGFPVKRADIFDCELKTWQAAIYYRFVHRRVGDRWWLTEVENWARAYLPLKVPVYLGHLHVALAEYQQILAAAGMLSLPRGYNRVNAVVTDDLTTLATPPNRDLVLRLAGYRKTLSRHERAGP